MYADVIVDLSLEKLDRIFQYRIPEFLATDLRVGNQVLVPFGKGNRMIKGYVVSFSKSSDYPVEKMKWIQQVVQGSTSIEGRTIELAWWMRKIYGATMSQTLKTIVPVKKTVRGQEKKRVVLLSRKKAMDFLERLDKRSKAKQRLLEALLEQKEGELGNDIITEKLHIALSTIRALEKDGLIEVKKEEIYRNPSIYQTQQIQKRVQYTQEQENILVDFSAEYRQGIRRTYLLHGVTGSGKTEVYMEMIAMAIEMEKQAIVLIPEIALTYQTVMRFYERFGERVTIMNSRMSQGERYDQYERAKRGEVDIMIGPRSALFAPFSRLGLIVIDEEHEGTYKSETVPKYHARETAIKLAELTDSSVILGSATPSVDSYYRALQGEYKLYEMKARVTDRELPSVIAVDLRQELREGNRSIFSRKLHDCIADRLERKQQTILFINRRGYAGFVSCRACGKVIRCPHCDVSLTSHRDGTLRCHYCGYQIQQPDTCPECGSKYIAAFGTGTQKVEEAVKKEFPLARALRMDMDTTGGKDGHEKILSAFANQEADILIGTQMIVKGHDFPLVTLVGVIAADLSLFEGDYHSAERTFQLLTQAAGRAGRGTEKGEVVIQTYNPEHYSVQMAVRQDYAGFYAHEMLYRMMLKYPPAGHMMAILLTSAEAEFVERAALWLKQRAEESSLEDMFLVGPAEANIAKICDIYRQVLYIRHENLQELIRLKERLEDAVNGISNKKDLQVQFDMDPMRTY